MNDAGDAHDVGSLGDEAAKLLGALSGWARDHAGDASNGWSGLASQAAASAHGLNDHLATGSAECTVCPVCRSVHALPRPITSSPAPAHRLEGSSRASALAA